MLTFVYEIVFAKASTMRVRDVIVFTIGGVTYEESAAVHQLNRQSSASGSAAQPLNVILGGTHVHNARSFIEQVLMPRDNCITLSRNAQVVQSCRVTNEQQRGSPRRQPLM